MVIELNQLKAEIFVFIKKDEQGRIILIATVFADDMVVLGIHNTIDN
jgi:hypothetical protein